jgi:glucose-1-phosphate thymidylyltransferase
LERSARGELEITDLNRTYLADGRLSVRVLPPGIAWFDTGTVENLHEASHYVRGVQVHRGIPVGSPEYSAWKSGFLTKQEFEQRAEQLVKSAYGQLLLSCLEGGPEPGLLQGARAQERAAASVTERVLDALPSVVAHDSSR